MYLGNHVFFGFIDLRTYTIEGFWFDQCVVTIIFKPIIPRRFSAWQFVHRCIWPRSNRYFMSFLSFTLHNLFWNLRREWWKINVRISVWAKINDKICNCFISFKEYYIYTSVVASMSILGVTRGTLYNSSTFSVTTYREF